MPSRYHSKPFSPKSEVNFQTFLMVGGNEAVFSRCLPVFQALGKTIVYVGESGSGQVVKACNQVVAALTIEAVSEALVLGSKSGVDPVKILQVLGGGLAANKVMELRGEGMLHHNFAPGFRIRLHHKDLGIALATGRAFGVPLPVTALVDQMFASMESWWRRRSGSLRTPHLPGRTCSLSYQFISQIPYDFRQGLVSALHRNSVLRRDCFGFNVRHIRVRRLWAL